MDFLYHSIYAALFLWAALRVDDELFGEEPKVEEKKKGRYVLVYEKKIKKKQRRFYNKWIFYLYF